MTGNSTSSWRRRALPILLVAPLLCSGCKPSPPQSQQDGESAEPSTQQSSSASSPAQANSAPALPVDAQYAQLLKELVDDEGLVRYSVLDDPSRLAALKASIDRMAAASLPEDKSQRIALLCNAYNANALLLTYEASRQPDFKTVNDTAGFFDGRTFKVAGKEFTLDRLKDDIRALQDPRIHCALVWGARGCPPLLNEPLSADRLERQFSEHCKRWIEDKSRNVTLNMRIQISDIFRQHEDDFKVEPYNDYKRFIYKFAQPGGMMREHIKHLEEGLVQITWWPFDWNLNASGSSAAGAVKEN